MVRKSYRSSLRIQCEILQCLAVLKTAYIAQITRMVCSNQASVSYYLKQFEEIGLVSAPKKTKRFEWRYYSITPKGRKALNAYRELVKLTEVLDE